MMTPAMKVHHKMQQAIRKSRSDFYNCFAGKTKMTMAQLRSFDKKNKKRVDLKESRIQCAKETHQHLF